MIRSLNILIPTLLLMLSTGIKGQVSGVVPEDRLVVDGFEISGNTVTKEPIILRELVFGLGDTIPKIELLNALHRSRENLLNTQLFNFVYFDVEHQSGNRIIVQITLTERWYIWPVPILEYAERNFSEFIKNKEWDKIVYGAWLRWSNFRGRRETLAAKVRLGYINEYALSYDVPNLGRKQQHRIFTGIHVNHQNEVNVNTINNQPVDYSPRQHPAQVHLNAYSQYTFRRRFYSSHSLRLDYNDYLITDSVMIVNPNYLGFSELTGEPLNQMRYFSLKYSFIHDTRDSKVYPLDGFMFKFSATQQGLGFIPEFPYSSLRLGAVFMFHEVLSRRIFFHNATKGRYSFQKEFPHVLNRALGYNVFMSAYEPYVLDGSDYIISKYNLKFQLIKPTTRTLPLINMEQFNKIHYALYLNVFADAGYVYDELPNPTNTLLNNFQYSAGIGLDLVTYYDQVFRIDFAINRYKEYGVFFHLETPFYRW